MTTLASTRPPSLDSVAATISTVATAAAIGAVGGKAYSAKSAGMGACRRGPAARQSKGWNPRAIAGESERRVKFPDQGAANRGVGLDAVEPAARRLLGGERSQRPGDRGIGVVDDAGRDAADRRRTAGTLGQVAAVEPKNMRRRCCRGNP